MEDIMSANNVYESVSDLVLEFGQRFGLFSKFEKKGEPRFIIPVVKSSDDSSLGESFTIADRPSSTKTRFLT